MSKDIVNRVVSSGIVTIDLETFYPQEAIEVIDLKDFLFMGMLLKEKEFRQTVKNYDWQQFKGKLIAIDCSVDAIIPRWAYMLLVSYLLPLATTIWIGRSEDFAEDLLLQNMKQAICPKDFIDKRVVVRGCGDRQVSAKVYGEITKLLLPYVKSLMYGEACSAVPVFKKK